MDRYAAAAASALSVLFLGSASSPDAKPVAPPPLIAAQSYATLVPAVHAAAGFGRSSGPLSLKLPDPVEPPPPPTPQEALRGGVLIVVSLASQQAFVFKKGQVWDSSEVSTGKLGNETPAGIFPILQKKVHHRSTLYDDAPMPYMQRLTWDGVALHAGRVPGYPASHGCVRLPKAFAEKLYGITNFSSTVVVVTDKPVVSANEARKAAVGPKADLSA